MDSFSDNEMAILVIGLTFLFTLLINIIIFLRKRNETNKQSEIIKAVIEKNPDLDIEDILKKLNPKTKTLKEKLMSNLKTATILIAIGIGVIILGYVTDNVELAIGCAIILILIGIAYLITYFVNKKAMHKELEAEEQQTLQSLQNKEQK